MQYSGVIRCHTVQLVMSLDVIQYGDVMDVITQCYDETHDFMMQ